MDDDGCCNGLKNYDECMKLKVHKKCLKRSGKQCAKWRRTNKCRDVLVPLEDKDRKHYSRDVVVTGTVYSVKNSHVNRRRRLLQAGTSS